MSIIPDPYGRIIWEFEGKGDPERVVGYVLSIISNVLAVLINALFITAVMRKSSLPYLVQTCLTILNLTLMALYQFYVIVLEKPALSIKAASLLMASTWGAVAVIAGLPFLTPESNYIPHPSGWHCAINIVAGSPYAKFLGWLDIILFLGTPGILGLLYGLILRKISQTIKSNYVPTNTAAHVDNNMAMRLIEKKVVTRAIYIEWLVTIVRQQWFSWQLEMWVSWLVRLNPLVNPILCIYLDPKVYDSLREMFGLEAIDRSKNSTSATAARSYLSSKQTTSGKRSMGDMADVKEEDARI
ncbi:hypothetical protein EDD86DRAFT_244535 [Gorgonomyces haynaldii]|nr:hypothetical protein EDD86DRAFT_244535 [Gorgonomyces haynaldii]